MPGRLVRVRNFIQTFGEMVVYIGIAVVASKSTLKSRDSENGLARFR